MLFLMGEIGSFLSGLYGSHLTTSDQFYGGPISQDCIAYVALHMSGTIYKKLSVITSKKNNRRMYVFRHFNIMHVNSVTLKSYMNFLGNCNHGKCFKSILILRNIDVDLKAYL